MPSSTITFSACMACPKKMFSLVTFALHQSAFNALMGQFNSKLFIKLRRRACISNQNNILVTPLATNKNGNKVRYHITALKSDKPCWSWVTLNVKLCMKGLSYNKSRGGLQNRKVDSFTIYDTLKDWKTKAGRIKKNYVTRKAWLTIHYCIGNCQLWFAAEFL